MFTRLRSMVLVATFGLLASVPLAQAESLEDVRRDISTLSAMMQDLRTELLTTGETGVSQDSVGTILQRLNMLETELSAAMGRIETLQFRVVQIAEDGTRRIGDLEFRLTELEGGDTSALGSTPPLGGDAGGQNTPILATDEQRSYDEATAEFEGGNFMAAASKFGSFITTYPGGPLTTEAQFKQGQALAGLQDWGGAARSFLDAFSGAPDGPLAAESLFELSVSLGALGQGEQACLTLNEIGIRYPDRTAELIAKINAQQQQMSCL